jgi:DNA-binding IclR family transcriptional regulator
LENNFLEPAPVNGFLLGGELLYLVMSAYERHPAVIAAVPVLKRLSRQWNATFVLYRYHDNWDVEWLAKEEV